MSIIYPGNFFFKLVELLYNPSTLAPWEQEKYHLGYKYLESGITIIKAFILHRSYKCAAIVLHTCTSIIVSAS